MIIDAMKKGVGFLTWRNSHAYVRIGQRQVSAAICVRNTVTTSITPDCCEDRYKITLAGSQFLKSAESLYAPVEGKALAITYALKQTKFFTFGCYNLVIVIDHEPLTKVLWDCTLDEISNTRLLKLKQHTLPWRFIIRHLPGKSNHFTNATSRSPVSNPEDDDDEFDDEEDIELAFFYISEVASIQAVTLDIVKKRRQPSMQLCSPFWTTNQDFQQE